MTLALHVLFCVRHFMRVVLDRSKLLARVHLGLSTLEMLGAQTVYDVVAWTA